MPSLTRRDFLKLTGLTALGLAFDSPRAHGKPNAALGRVTAQYLRVHLRPDGQSKQVAWLGFDEVVQITDTVVGKDKHLWHEIAAGYVDTREVQPVERRLNRIQKIFPEGGSIGEVTVPFIDARRKPEARAPVAYRLYYGSTFWVREVVADVWYKLYDERLGIYYYAEASALRIVPASELTPLSPAVHNKRILINLQQQRVYAYEGRSEVFSASISSGRLYLDSDGVTARSWTPSGDFVVDRKRPSRHMGFGEAAGSDYELPGVPWVSYFHWKGYSFHGTWWHNDYGHPRSAGCINMLPQDAKWIFRWTQPDSGADQEVITGDGTPVEIVES
jgi:lipoprotein-anchoring transpeptidase ErfK/SrfK